VDSAWQGPAPVGDPAWERLDAALVEAGVVRLAMARGARVDWDGARIRVLGPRPPRRPPLRVRNEDSLVMDVQYGEVHLLLTGDVAGEAEREIDAPPSILMKVPHHGSRSSSSLRLIEVARPRLAIVSCGARNPFGHPDRGVLERYGAAGALVLRTDRDGAIRVSTDGRRLWVATVREGHERRIR
jgi:competence protein ComEC